MIDSTVRLGTYIHAVLAGRLTEACNRTARDILWEYDGEEFAWVTSCIPNTSGQIHWSVMVHHVQWRLAPNDHRRAMARRGIWPVAYANSLEAARTLALSAINQRLASQAHSAVILPMQTALDNAADE